MCESRPENSLTVPSAERGGLFSLCVARLYDPWMGNPKIASPPLQGRGRRPHSVPHWWWLCPAAVAGVEAWLSPALQREQCWQFCAALRERSKA